MCIYPRSNWPPYLASPCLLPRYQTSLSEPNIPHQCRPPPLGSAPRGTHDVASPLFSPPAPAEKRWPRGSPLSSHHASSGTHARGMSSRLHPSAWVFPCGNRFGARARGMASGSTRQTGRQGTASSLVPEGGNRHSPPRRPVNPPGDLHSRGQTTGDSAGATGGGRRNPAAVPARAALLQSEMLRCTHTQTSHKYQPLSHRPAQPRPPWPRRGPSPHRDDGDNSNNVWLFADLSSNSPTDHHPSTSFAIFRTAVTSATKGMEIPIP